MSEETKPVCVRCGCAIIGKVYGDVGRDWPRHFCTISCTRAERDYLRAENERLREELAQRRERTQREIEAGRPTGGVG